MKWNLADTKNRLSELLDRARRDGPQIIQRRKDAFVLLPADQFEQLTGKSPTFTDWLLNGPRIDDLNGMPRSGSLMQYASL